MAEVHVTTQGVVFHNPAREVPVPAGVGQPVSQVKDASGKVISTSGQVPGTTVIHNNPA